MNDVSSPTGLIQNFQTQLEHQWQRFRRPEGDDTARGNSYESALKDLLDEYFGGRFDVISNCSVMDADLACFDSFGQGAQNEVDVLALFSHATPRVVLREAELNWVPLEGVSLLCEVKSRVDKGRLESDLRKLEILRELEVDPDDRFSTKISGEYTVDHQIHCLVYDRGHIADETLNTALADSTAWDVVLLVEDDTLIVNETLPFVEYLSPLAVLSQTRNIDGLQHDDDQVRQAVLPGSEGSTCLSVSNGLAWFILLLSSTIPVPLSVSASSCISELLRHSVTGIRLGASTRVTEDDTVEWEETDSGDPNGG